MRGLVIAALFSLAGPAAAQQAGLPGGASQLTERHGSWSVRCGVTEAGKECAFSQSAGNPETRTPLVAVELGAPAADKAEGMLLTDFGLRLDAGIQLAIDGAQLGAPLPFLTCVATGCLVPLDFDAVAVSALKVGQALEVTGLRAEDGQPVAVALPLAGFTAAFNRTVELAK